MRFKPLTVTEIPAFTLKQAGKVPSSRIKWLRGIPGHVHMFVHSHHPFKKASYSEGMTSL
jgi:hypothetical protein